MSRWFSRLTVAALLVSALSFAFAGGAFAGTGGGPDDAMTPNGQAATLAMGQRVWYAFQYTGDESNITVRLTNNPSGYAAFSVWTRDNITTWAQGGAEAPVGRGTQSRDSDGNLLYNGDLVWTGNFRQGGTYYIAVDQTGGTTGTYQLSVAGSGVYYSNAAGGNQANSGVPLTLPQTGNNQSTNASTSNAPAAAPQAAPQGAPQAVSNGKGPDTAYLSNTDSGTLAPGERRWFAFRPFGNDFQTFVRLHSDNSGAVAFSVWTPQNVRDWAAGSAESPEGRGTVNKDKDGNTRYNGDLIWLGNPKTPGPYYVAVDNTSQSPANYQLSIMQSLAPSSTSIGSAPLTQLPGGGY